MPDPPSGRNDPMLETIPVGPSSAQEAIARARPYLLVVEGSSARTVELPELGDVTIGRGDDADVRLADAGISRRHARIVTADGDATVVDEGSQNGTRVQGERIIGSRPLLPGDLIEIGDATLVFHAPPRRVTAASFVDLSRFRRQAEQEVERSRVSDAPLAVVALSFGSPVDGPLVEGAVARALGPVGSATWVGEDALVLLPDTGRDAAEAACDRLVHAATSSVGRGRGGWACAPGDGCDLPALLESARAAARAATDAGQAAAAETVRRLRLGSHEAIVADAAMLRLYALLERLAPSSLPVLVGGETGTGKELAAAALHFCSPRRDGPFVPVNCAALSEGLVESELFGHDKGAFTGAISTKVGFFEAAHGGTIFLDEVGELPPLVQAKLLRVLEERRFTRVGSAREIEVDVRVVAATNRDLAREATEQRFRQDLYFRLSGAMVWLPPLRDRPRELPILARAFLEAACAEARRPSLVLGDGALRALARHGWPGNVRELRNLMGFLAAIVTGDRVDEVHLAERLGLSPTLPAAGAEPPAPAPPAGAGSGGPRFRPIADEVRDLERTRMAEALAAAGGNRTRAAELLSMPLRTFMSKLKQYDLARAGKGGEGD